MDVLETRFRTYGRRRRAQWWIGDRPDCAHDAVARSIATHIGYPTAARDPFADGLLKLDGRQAAFMLAVAGTVGLAYGFQLPCETEVERAAKALDALGRRRWFFGNGLWRADQGRTWTPLSAATFDCGLIGFDQAQAFIFWVEEED